MVKIKTQWAALLLAIIVFVVPTAALAGDGDFESPKAAFTWYQKGQGCMHLKLMTSNADPYRTLHTATYGVIGKDGKKTPVFEIAEDDSGKSGYTISHFTNFLSGSLLYLTNDTKWKPLCLIYEGPLQEHHHTRNGKDNGYAELDWYYPISFAGQSLTFYVDATLYRSGGETLPYYKEIGTMEFDEITLEAYDAFPATDVSESGMLKIPFVSNRQINTIQASYTDEFGRRKTLERVTLEKGMYSGFINIPATDVHKDLTLTANVISGKPNDGDVPNGEWPKELTGDVSTTLAKVPMIHAPRMLTAKMQTDSACNASVLLKWQIANKDFEDVLDGEMFLVQRSMTGRLEDFVDIGSVEFDNKDTNYEYEDVTLIDALQPELIDVQAGFPLVRYRVVRASTRELWAMDHNPAVAYVMPRMKPLVLVKPKDVETSWSDEENHKVKLTWAYEKGETEVDEPGYKGGDCHFVWDDRAEMRVVTLMYNRDGGLVDSLTHVLTRTERESREVELTLNRSCVSYDVRLVVDGKTSPIGKATGNLLVVIKSQDDWNRFAKRVNNGETTLNAILNGFSPRITSLDQTVGTTSRPFRGIFLGNNEELTTNLNVTVNTVGPFRALGHGAVIAFGVFNSTITTNNQFASGVAGRINNSSTAFIENCIVDFKFHTNSNGDGSHGSLVALLNKDESLFASNVLVKGTWEGDKTTNCGGLVGYARGTAFVSVDRVYFGIEPTKDTGAFTLVRTSAVGETNAIIRDCYYKTAFGKVQGTQANAIPSTWGWAANGPVDGDIFFPAVRPLREVSATLPADKFYYENHGQVLESSLRVRSLRSSALLTWETDGGTVDYFEVYRIKTDDPNPDNWERIATQLIDMQYEDQNTSPVHTYKYYVQSANDCEGTSYVKTAAVEGGCFQTCTLEGYVKFPDGTGIFNRPVNITEDRKDGKTYTAMTDANGHFIMDNLPYWDGGVAAYRVSPNVPGYTGMQTVRFGTEPGQNYISGVEFEVTNNVKFSGYVQYNGTSIPVQGVHFLVDGVEARTASGPVESDHEGKFSFRMLPGKHNIQAVKDGHDFYDGGWYYADEQNKSSKDYNFQTDKAGIYFYDDTRVKLIGRVAGGNDQGALPLDNSLSRNNLGDDLEMVFVLEGDNVSRLVWDILDRTKKETDSVYVHKSYDQKYKYQTQVHTTEHRMVVKPDPHTGEYMVMLPPVKWKIQQITAKGYPTLFQEGMINDVIDLTDSLTKHRDVLTGEWVNANGEPVTQVVEEYNAKYSRIYRSPVILDRQQLGYDNFNYFGDRYYTAKNLEGEKVKVPLCYPVDEKSTEAKYTFGYPVFNTDRQYPVKISAVEKYYYNNNTKSDTVDVVKLSGGVVTIRNSMVSATHRDTVHLDSLGERIYILEAKQMPYSLTGEDALHLVTMTLELDGTHFEAEPLRAYVLNTYVRPGAKDILSIDKPELVDILRDPPGGGSSAKLSRGSTLKYSYTFDWSAAGGLTLGFAFGQKVNQYVGVVAVAAESGVINNGESDFAFDVDLMFSGSGKKAYSYTMTANSDISTSSASTMVGAKADIYIGTETSYVVTPALAIRAIDSTMWKQLEGPREAGALVEIATGRDESGHTVHLVRDEVLSIGPKIKSTFMHSQAYILDQLIPNLEQECKSLLFTGEKEEAQAVADSTGKAVYWSLRKPDDDNFGVVNTEKAVKKGDNSWTYFYNTSIDKAQEGINYMIIFPKGYQGEREDRIAEFSQSALWWAEMVARNEKEKLEATTLVKNFDIDGGVPLSYSEDFSADISYTAQVHYFWESTPSNIVTNGVTWLAKLIGKKMGSAGDIGPEDNNENDIKEGNINWAGYSFKFLLTPHASYNFNTPYSTDKKFNRKESFTISMDKKSHLVVDVYAAKNQFTDGSEGTFEVFSNKNFYKAFDTVDDEVKHDIVSYPDVGKVSKSDLTYPRSFVYRTRGGATARPWEGERKTKFYRSGTVLDERTKKIENPVIKLDKQSVSGIPIYEPARFKVYLTNESEQPEAIGGMLQYFYLYLDDTSNPKGAKLMMDGMPLTRGGTMVMVVPGSVTEKTIEVWPGEDFDYENLRIGIISLEDIDMYQEIEFSVHFLQEAGPVEIAMPGDKWIMNTDAAYDKERGWHMPVIISGFNKNQKNFDHIEFQYKESTRGDDYWTNLCAFYADSTYYIPASGTKAMIPENGNIVTDFYGEGVVMEKAYDLRAVLFCRNGNSYLTTASKVLSGVKDTRRPQLFGTPEPKDGILGAGDNIVFNFSEPIEYNYLRETTNFEVKGETNETTIQEEPALLFNGSGYAQSEARRNFAEKDVTIEVMVRPDAENIDMPIFSHGTDGKQLQLWLTKDKRLKAVVDDQTLTMDKPIEFAGGFVQVAMALDNGNQRLTLYADTMKCSLDSVTYSGYGPIIFGSTNQIDVNKRKYYKGRMLQGRVWNRVMDNTLLTFYGEKLLTGYEMGLTDYYPMNEGRGKYALDEAQGAHLTLNGASWSQPRGMSLLLDWDEQRQVKGMKLKPAFFSRTSEQDYTLMFWFRTDVKGRGALLSNGSGYKTDVAAEDKFFIGFEADTLKYRSNGMEFKLGNDYSDDAWHHYAMTVNRAHQVASIYIDNVLKAQFTTENLGGMSGDDFYLGNMVWHEQGTNNDVMHQYNALTGHLDGICLFEQALPISLIKRYNMKALGGGEHGLITYLDFNRQERQKNGDLLLRPYTLSQKIHYDLDGKDTGRRDTVFIDTDDFVSKHIDQNIGAPLQSYEELRNLNFSYTGRDNQILINLDELDSRINKRTVYATIYDIPDLNGNYMASPATVAIYVDRNPLRWEQKTYRSTMWYDPDYDFTFSVKVINNSGAPHTFEISNLPKWLSAGRMSDVIEAKSEMWIDFSINKDTNVGTYDHIIYLTDENGLSEPLMLNITVEGKEPDWYVDPNMKEYSMSVVGRVQIGGDVVTDPRDMVVAFDSNDRCMGVANISYSTLSGEALVYMSLYTDNSSNTEELKFKLWHYATGKVMVLEPSKSMKFRLNGTEGTIKEPIVFQAGNLYIQELDLKKGWNWISFNVYNKDLRDGVNAMLKKYKWEEGDILVDETNSLMLVYKDLKWLCNLTPGNSVTPDSVAATNKLTVANSYRIKLSKDVKIELTGTVVKQPAERVITVKNGWNHIGYTPTVNLTVQTALADYFDQAEDGDVVKSKTEFAMFSKGANGSREWKGNLKYMKPGEGYMLSRQREGTVTFKYPYYESNTTIVENAASRETESMSRSYANTMSLAAVTDGIELQEGDRLLALSEAEVRGEAFVGDSVVYMSISGDSKTPLSFAIEREGEIVAMTGDVLSYEANKVSGTPDEPTRITFAPVSVTPQEGWYTLQGIRLQGKPAKSGVYIYNGHKRIIR